MTSQPREHEHRLGHGPGHRDERGHAAGEHDPTCHVAHGTAPALRDGRALVAVFATPVAPSLLRHAADAGYRPVLVEPDVELAKQASADWLEVRSAIDGELDARTDVVVTDHHRGEIGVMLRDALATRARWVGIMGSPRHEPPHVQALALL